MHSRQIRLPNARSVSGFESSEARSSDGATEGVFPGFHLHLSVDVVRDLTDSYERQTRSLPGRTIQ